MGPPRWASGLRGAWRRIMWLESGPGVQRPKTSAQAVLEPADPPLVIEKTAEATGCRRFRSRQPRIWIYSSAPAEELQIKWSDFSPPAGNIRPSLRNRRRRNTLFARPAAEPPLPAQPVSCPADDQERGERPGGHGAEQHGAEPERSRKNGGKKSCTRTNHRRRQGDTQNRPPLARRCPQRSHND